MNKKSNSAISSPADCSLASDAFQPTLAKMRSPSATDPNTEVLVVPGLFEHHFMLASLIRALRRDGWNPRIWDDRIAFRQIDRSIDRLRSEIEMRNRPLHVITHSFGDWLVRQAIDTDLHEKIGAFIGIAPVMRSSWIPKMVQAATGDWIPELAIIANRHQAAAKIESFSNRRRLLIWAKLDAWVREVPHSELGEIESISFWATHLTVVWDSRVHQCVNDFLQTASSHTNVQSNRLVGNVPDNARRHGDIDRLHRFGCLD